MFITYHVCNIEIKNYIGYLKQSNIINLMLVWPQIKIVNLNGNLRSKCHPHLGLAFDIMKSSKMSSIQKLKT